MAITDKLTTIKDYFLDWHERYYNALHKKTIEDLEAETENRIAGDNDLLRRITYPNFLAAQAKDKTRNQTVQTTLDNFNTKLNTNAEIGDINGLAYAEYDVRGLDPKITGKKQNGLMTWKDKAELKALGIWYECVHPNNKTKTYQYPFRSIPKHGILWVNPSLRICYFKWSYSNFPKSYWDGDWYCTPYSADAIDLRTEGGDPATLWDQVAPISTIWAPTNHPKIMMGIDSDGFLHLRSVENVTKTYSINGSLMWFYRDNPSYGRWK